MAINVKEIEDRDFKTTFLRGYSINEVDDFLDDVAVEMERLQQLSTDLQAKVDAFAEKERRIAEMEQTLRDTLITAQRAAEDVIRASREKAAAMIKDSELEGRRIMEDAELQAQSAAQRRESINRDVAGVKALIKKVIGEQMRLLDESYPDGGSVKAPVQQAAKPAQALPTLADFDQTQEFSAREVREQAFEEERTVFPRFRNFNERLPQIEQNGDAQV